LFLFLFGALELTGEQIIHDQGRDKRGDAKIYLRVVIVHVQPELIATLDQSGQ
jgi:hypothetical protein